jgi:MFS family permease
MAIYTCALSAGVGGGIVISGLITINHGWRTIYWVSLALIAACTCLVVFSFPETIYRRSEGEQGEASDLRAITPLGKPYTEHHEQQDHHHDEKEKIASKGTPTEKDIEATTKPAIPANTDVPAKRTYWQNLRLFSGIYTEEPFWQLFIRPVVLLTLPPVLWATLVMSGTIGFLVAITSNFAPAFENAYNFKPWQAGLCFIGALIGSFSGIAVGGHFSDWIADKLTKKNGGIREPEMRLPAIAVSVITAPLALVLYGVGVNNHLHWICPTFGLLLSK